MCKPKQTEKELEILIRGETLCYSTKIETILEIIITYCNGIVEEDDEDKGFQFKNMQWKDKVRFAKEGVQKSYSDLVDEYTVIFEELAHMSFRHHMAHRGIVWNLKEKLFTVWEVKIKEDGAPHEPVIYTLAQANIEIKRLAEIAEKITILLSIIVGRFERLTGLVI